MGSLLDQGGEHGVLVSVASARLLVDPWTLFPPMLLSPARQDLEPVAEARVMRKNTGNGCKRSPDCGSALCSG